MGKDGEGHGPRCKICQRFFTPDPRQGDRQRCCGGKPCRQEYKNLWQREKYARDLPRARAAVGVRVRRHRWNTRGKKRFKDDSAITPATLGDLSDVTEAVIGLEATVNGLAARATNCGSDSELFRILAKCREHGLAMLPRQKKSAVTGHVPEAECRCNGTRPCASNRAM